MTPAPVGFQCPDCVRAGQQEVAQKSGGTLATTSGRPIVTWSIVGVCAVAYLVQMIVGDQVAVEYGMWPRAIGLEQQWYRLVTSMFLHGSLLHILFNMYVLVTLGPTLERILGHGRFLLLYLLAGFGGAVASYVFSAPMTLSVGASGAIFGLMGALLVAGRRLRYDVTMVAVLIAINVAIGFLFSSGIDWRAHLGGLATGAALAAVMVGKNGRRPIAVEAAGIAGVTVVLIIMIAFRTAQFAAITG